MEFCDTYSRFFIAQGRNSVAYARQYLGGLLSDTLDKNIERIEEKFADVDYESVQHFISSSKWDQGALLAQLAIDVDSLLGGDEHTSLVIDETCFAKKGNHSVGVQRQYNGNLGKVDNCQCGVFSALACGDRSSFIDFALYMPKQWLEDSVRCDRAKVPAAHREFRTKIDIALEQVSKAVQNGVRFSWVGADSLYGHSNDFRNQLEDSGLNYVCDIKKNFKLTYQDEAQSIECLALNHFAKRSEFIRYRSGTKGSLQCQCACFEVQVGERSATAIISKDDHGGFKYSLTNMGGTVTQHAYRQHQRYWIEDGFKRAKSDLGMADYQVRGWIGWHHHIALVCLAQFFTLRQSMLFVDSLPLLSTRDVVCLLEYFLPQRQRSFEDVCNAMLFRHQKRLRDIQNSYNKEFQSIPKKYLPK